jgi:hypothetical protein
MKSKWQQQVRLAIAALTLAGVAVTSTGCGLIWPVRERRDAPAQSGFLGDYSQLAPKEGYKAQEVYINPNAAWLNYNAVYIDSVSLWITDPSKRPSPEDAQMLTDMLYKSLSDKVGAKFALAQHPAAGVIRVRVALTEAKGARVALNAITTVIPQLRLVTTLGGLAADSAVLVGAASAEAEILDSVTNQRLAAAIDALAGTKGLMRAFSKWADVQAACDDWGDRMTNFLIKQGMKPKA